MKVESKPFTKEEKKLLDNRLKRYYQNPQNIRTWVEFKKGLLKKRKISG